MSIKNHQIVVDFSLHQGGPLHNDYPPGLSNKEVGIFSGGGVSSVSRSNWPIRTRWGETKPSPTTLPSDRNLLREGIRIPGRRNLIQRIADSPHPNKLRNSDDLVGSFSNP